MEKPSTVIDTRDIENRGRADREIVVAKDLVVIENPVIIENGDRKNVKKSGVLD